MTKKQFLKICMNLNLLRVYDKPSKQLIVIMNSEDINNFVKEINKRRKK